MHTEGDALIPRRPHKTLLGFCSLSATRLRTFFFGMKTSPPAGCLSGWW